MKTIIIGLGNPILGDDGVGWRIVEQVELELQAAKGNLQGGTVECALLSLGGLTLMEHLIDYDFAILVDAIYTGQQPHGSVSSFWLETLPNRAAGHMSSGHDTTLQDAIRMGRQMGANLPERIGVVAVESPLVYEFSETLSPPATAAVPQAVRAVFHFLAQNAPAHIAPAHEAPEIPVDDESGL